MAPAHGRRAPPGADEREGRRAAWPQARRQRGWPALARCRRMPARAGASLAVPIIPSSQVAAGVAAQHGVEQEPCVDAPEIAAEHGDQRPFPQRPPPVAHSARLPDPGHGARRGASARPAGAGSRRCASTPSTSRGPGRTTMPSASIAQTGTPGSARATVARLLDGAGQVVPARRDQDDLRARPRRSPPSCLHRRSPGPGRDRLAARGADQVGHPVPGGERRIHPLDDRHPRAAPPGHARRDPVQPGRSPAISCAARSGDAGALPDREDRVQHLPQRVRIQRQHVGLAAQVVQRVLDLTRGSAQTRHRSWVRISSGSSPASAWACSV